MNATLLSQYKQQAKNDEVRNWVETVLPARDRKNLPMEQTEVEHIIDFLNSDKAPTRLSKMSYDQAKAGAEKWTKTLIKKADNIVETDEDVKVILRSRKTGFRLVRLIGEAAFKREGALMRHCVGSYASKKDVEIYSLRDAKNEPHCTIEVVRSGASEQIQQIKGKGNGPIHPNYIKYVLKILKYFKMPIRDSELSNLGYISLSDEYWELVEEVYGTNYKYITYGNKKYLYNLSIKDR